MSKLKLCVFILITQIVGCATLSKDQCLLSQWEDIGYQDGLNGHDYVRIEQHQRACSKHGVAVNSDEYHHGYDEGISQYCHSFDHYQSGKEGNVMNARCTDLVYVKTYNSGVSEFCYDTNPYFLGAKGKEYNNVCGSTFSRLYEEGKGLYEYTLAVASLETKIERLHDQMAESHDPEYKANKRSQIRDAKDNLKIAKARVLAEKIKNKDQFSSAEILLDVLDATQ